MATAKPGTGDQGLWPKIKWPLAALALVLLFNGLFTAGFFQVEIKDGRLYGSLIDVLNRAAPVMLLSLGMTLVIATGGVDLSVGAVMAIAGAIAALAIKSGQPLMVVLALSLGSAVLAGAWNGLLVCVLEVQPIVATLILMVSGRGIAQLLTQVDGHGAVYEGDQQDQAWPFVPDTTAETKHDQSFIFRDNFDRIDQEDDHRDDHDPNKT